MEPVEGGSAMTAPSLIVSIEARSAPLAVDHASIAVLVIGLSWDDAERLSPPYALLTLSGLSFTFDEAIFSFGPHAP
jgi:hypothetical protein